MCCDTFQTQTGGADDRLKPPGERDAALTTARHVLSLREQLRAEEATLAQRRIDLAREYAAANTGTGRAEEEGVRDGAE